MLEKRSEPSDLPKANGLVGQIVELLDHRGLLERFSEGSPYAGRAPGFPFGEVPLRFDGIADIPLRLLLIQQPELERRLAERARELGVEIRRGCEVRALAQDGEGVTLSTSAGELRAAYAVGCDGAGSLVREQAGIAFPTTDEEGLLLGHFTAGPEAFAAMEATGLHPGWNRRPHGRVLVTSLRDGAIIAAVREGRACQDGPVSLADFQAAVRRVLGRELPLGEPIWLSGTSSQARLAERHRSGRVFLAGDAAHLFPAGGSALNAGMTDAVNLAWKLAGRLRGRVSEEVLDTYESERREFARRTLLQARAQAAIDRAEGETGEALRALLAEVFAFEGPARHLATLLHDAGVRYPSGEGAHPLAGRFVPDLALHGGRRVAELMREARPVLLDLGGGAALDDDWVRVVRASCDDPPADTLLIRPDGYVAWAGADGVEAAAEHWFGRAGTRAESVV